MDVKYEIPDKPKKFECSCGETFSISSRYGHLRSKIHFKTIEEKQKDKELNELREILKQININKN